MSAPIPVFTSEAESEEMDVICHRLSASGHANTLEDAAIVWGIFMEARKANNLELLRTYDTCYSKKHHPKVIRVAFNLLLQQYGSTEMPKVTPDGLVSYRLVSDALYNHKDFTTAFLLPREHMDDLNALALTTPRYGTAIAAIISERGITDPDEVRGLLKFMDETPGPLEIGIL